MKKTRPSKNNWYVWLTNFIPESIKNCVGGFKEKVISLFKTNTPNKVVYRREKKLNKLKRQK